MSPKKIKIVGDEEMSKSLKERNFQDPKYVEKMKTYFDYYTKQKVYSADDFKGSSLTVHLQTELPVCFWVTNKDGYHVSVVDEFRSMLSISHNYFEEVKWIKNTYFNATFKSGKSKRELKKLQVNKQMHDFLKRETEFGTVVRQEEVSMIPPILLDARNGHFVLDMCAAPGSKTCQIIEMMRFRKGPQKGALVALDSSFSRCHVLAKRVKGTGFANLAVINAVAQDFSVAKAADGSKVLFDRVLCDVPCSSDGTIRKSPLMAIKTWSPTRGLSLHRLQLMIARRGVQLLKPGGVLVYSTCSLNPLENEAVVAELLRSESGLVLEDVLLPGFKTREGLRDWLVPFQGQMLHSFDMLKSSPAEVTKKFIPTLFPPSEQKIRQQLNKCIRILPHDQNTGGFFVAKLTKRRETRSSPIRINYETERVSSENNFMYPFNRKKCAPEETCFLPISNELKIEISNYYGISEKNFLDNLFYRSSARRSENPNKIYFTPSEVISILKPLNRKNPRTILAGVCVFSKNDRRFYREFCKYRVMQETISFVLPFISKQKVECATETLKVLLNDERGMFDRKQLCSSLQEGLDQNRCGSVVLMGAKYDCEVPLVAQFNNNKLELMIGKKKIDWYRARINAN